MYRFSLSTLKNSRSSKFKLKKLRCEGSQREIHLCSTPGKWFNFYDLIHKGYPSDQEIS